MSDHAPAPWRVESAESPHRIVDANGNVIAEVGLRGFDFNNRLSANAHMLAIGPELIAEVEFWLDDLKRLPVRLGGPNWKLCIERLESLVAKARGVTP